MDDQAQKERVAKPKAIGAIALAPKAKKGGRQTINIHIGKIVQPMPGRYKMGRKESE